MRVTSLLYWSGVKQLGPRNSMHCKKRGFNSKTFSSCCKMFQYHSAIKNEYSQTCSTGQQCYYDDSGQVKTKRILTLQRESIIMPTISESGSRLIASRSLSTIKPHSCCTAWGPGGRGRKRRRRGWETGQYNFHDHLRY